ncbi:hypothetical protein KR51_00022580 [Rubidibacter lacunae KORDI 51-2]|uniref:Uncharacterized protein n=1 Tax=Rubidibacter lacunae KORDI 51-2 TaxID=582515 RepID=U5DKV8_9CHRO|nr:hypothetical protein [Rubidibacter lacunae]ERN41194.1 hypothetical protein KR51_00022580 [Rubidibacter lacunae KORDI 51-2]
MTDSNVCSYGFRLPPSFALYHELLSMQLLAVGGGSSSICAASAIAASKWWIGVAVSTLLQEPERLWRSYTYYNPLYTWIAALQGFVFIECPRRCPTSTPVTAVRLDSTRPEHQQISPAI